MQPAHSTPNQFTCEACQSDFLGIGFRLGSRDEILREITWRLGRPAGRSTLIAHVNLHSVYTSSAVRRMRQALAEPTTLVLFEGIALKLACFATTQQWWPDFSGTDLVPQFLAIPNRRPWRVALVGGAGEVVENAARSLAQGRPGIEVVAAIDGFADLAVGGVVQQRVKRAQPDLVLLGLGSPLQETIGADWARAGTAPVIWCVGGLFDLWAGHSKRAPAWMRASRIEWLWRLVRNPCRLWRRTFVEGPWLMAEVFAHRPRA